MAGDIEAEATAYEPQIPFRATTNHRHHTWAKTYWSRPELYVRPESLEEIQKLVTLARRCRRRIVVTGAGHSPSDITCTSSWLVNLDRYNSMLRVDKADKTIVVEGGISLHELNLKAKEHGLTMPNLGSIDEQSLSGAIATATHGSSIRHGLLSQSVKSLRLVLANGRAVRCSASQSPDLFRAALVSLGALGIIVEVEFQLTDLRNIEWVQTLQPLSHVLETWNTTLWTSAEFTRVWWLPYLQRAIVWQADKTDKAARAPKSSWYGGSVGFHTYHNLLWLSNYIPFILPWVEWFVFGMQYGFKPGSTNSGVEEQRTGLLMDCLFSQFVNEWALPLSKGPEALDRLGAWILGDQEKAKIPYSSKGLYVHAPIEVRVSDTSKVASSNSPQPRPFLDNTARSEPTLYLNATLYRAHLQDPPCHRRYYQAFEWLMRELGGKPHWAKNFAFVQREDLEEAYTEDLQSWRRVRDSVDPEGVFVGDWLRRNVLAEPKGAAGRGGQLPNEEVLVGVQSNRREGGKNWTGEQRHRLQTELREKGGTSSNGSDGVPPSASSQESFDVMHGAEAEASTLLGDVRSDEDDVDDDDDGNEGPVAARTRETTVQGLTGTRPFEKM